MSDSLETQVDEIIEKIGKIEETHGLTYTLEEIFTKLDERDVIVNDEMRNAVALRLIHRAIYKRYN